jgi:hypothetical protein
MTIVLIVMIIVMSIVLMVMVIVLMVMLLEGRYYGQWRSWLENLPRGVRGMPPPPRENLKSRTSGMAFPAISRVEGCH